EITTPFDFNYSHYYTKEMGENLQKVFLVFENLYDVSKAAQTKIKSNELEQKFAKNSQRTINLDPGYLTLAKLVLTTTKNYDHRIHIASGIYGDIQLRYRQGEFVENPWTYPDYRSSKNIHFFLQARQYLHNLVTKK
ncbi:DUF4416 family protein, partial [candidate division KSB1 bacterium]|nr:DUF4416 family protein [candidate division KSB1 bacterium]